MTPPVGLNLFISSFRFNKPITQLYRSVSPFIGSKATKSSSVGLAFE